MKRFDLAGAITLIVLAAAYLVASLLAGHSAASHPPADLAATDQGLDVYKATALLAEHQQQARVVDTRSKSKFGAYHVAGATNLPNATPRQLLKALGDHPIGLVIAPTDDAAAHLIGAAQGLDPERRLHFVQGGAQALYLTFELPVEAFTDRDAPFGYAESVATTREFLRTGTTEHPKAVRRALSRLSSYEFAPTQLSGKKAASPKKRKKISGGCG